MIKFVTRMLVVVAVAVSGRWSIQHERKHGQHVGILGQVRLLSHNCTKEPTHRKPTLVDLPIME